MHEAYRGLHDPRNPVHGLQDYKAGQAWGYLKETLHNLMIAIREMALGDLALFAKDYPFLWHVVRKDKKGDVHAVDWGPAYWAKWGDDFHPGSTDSGSKISSIIGTGGKKEQQSDGWSTEKPVEPQAIELFSSTFETS